MGIFILPAQADFELFLGGETVRETTNGESIVTYLLQGGDRSYACVARSEGSTDNVNQGIQFDMTSLQASGLQSLRFFSSVFSETSNQYLTFKADPNQMQVNLAIDVAAGGAAKAIGYFHCCLAEATVPFNTIFPEFAFLEITDKRVNTPPGVSPGTIPDINAEIIVFTQAMGTTPVSSRSVSLAYGGTVHVSVHDLSGAGGTFGRLLIRTDGLPSFLDIRLATYQQRSDGGLELVQKFKAEFPCATRAFKDTLG